MFCSVILGHAQSQSLRNSFMISGRDNLFYQHRCTGMWLGRHTSVGVRSTGHTRRGYEQSDSDSAETYGG